MKLFLATKKALVQLIDIRAPNDADDNAIEAIALRDDDVQRHLQGLTVRKVIVVKGRIVNIVAG